MSVPPEPVQLILQYGDLLERHVYSSDEFANEFTLYPRVWAKCVLPNRVPGKLALANRDWIRFAERHYSAMVRCWNTMQAKNHISSICHQNMDCIDAECHLELHESLLTFFCSAGAAIDNMRFAFASQPLNSGPAFEKIASRGDITKNLAWIFERRTQYIHKAVVPCFGHNGLLAFDASFFEDTETQWDHTRPLRVESVADLVDHIWRYFADQMNAAWSRLLEVLKDKSIDHRIPLVIEPLAPEQLQWSSGSPDEPYGSPMLPPPSGVRDEYYWEGGTDR